MTPSFDLPPLVHGRYRVLEALGAGAMGAVYRVADDQAGGRLLALKVLAGSASPAATLRFREEFRAMARLRHPGTVAVHDFGTLEGGDRYLVMDLVPGRDLDAVLADGQFPLGEVAGVLLALAQALAYLHARLYLHRDVKASNVRLDGARVVLLDYGLMSQVGVEASGDRLTGTPDYMAPEAIRGGALGPGVDFYALGCLGYALVTGRPPFEGSLEEVLAGHLGEVPAKPSLLRAGVPPRLEKLLLRLLEKDPAKRPAGAAITAELAALAGVETRPDAAEAHGYLASAPLVGREEPLARLHAAWQRARAGAGAAAFISAPGGLGKSRLALELVTEARALDAHVATLRGREGGMAPYEAIAAALATLRGRGAPPPPGLAFLWADGAAAPPPPVVAELIAGWVAALAAERPVVLFADDLQWADAASVQALNQGLAAWQGARCLVLATVRGDEVPPASPVWQPVRDGLADRIELAPLGAAEAAELAGAMLGGVPVSAAAGERLHAATAGNPFFLAELLRHAAEGGRLAWRDGAWRMPADGDLGAVPATVAELVQARLARLEPDARAALEVLAVLGARADLATALAASGMAEEPFFEALAALQARQLVYRDGEAIAFWHDRVREAVEQGLAPERRQALHARAAVAIAASPEPPPLALARHLAEAGEPAAAAGWFARAAEQALGRGAIAAAIDGWLAAIAQRLAGGCAPDDADLHAWRWQVGSRAFTVRPAAAVEALQPFLHLQEALESPAERPRALQARAFLAAALGFAGRPAAALAAADGLEARAEGLPPAFIDALGMARAAALLGAGRIDALRALAEGPGRRLLALETDDPYLRGVRTPAAGLLNAGCYQGVRPDLDALARAEADARAAGYPQVINTSRHYAAVWYAWTGRAAQCEALLEEMAALARRLGAPPDPAVLWLRTSLALLADAPIEAAAAAARAEAFPHVRFGGMAGLLVRGEGALARAALGEPGAVAALEGLVGEADGAGLAIAAMRLRLALASLDPVNRAADLATALAVATAPLTRNPLHEAIGRRLEAERALALHDLPAAAAALARAAELLADPSQDNPLEASRLALVQGRLAEASGDKAAAQAAYRQAGKAADAIAQRGLREQALAALERLR